MKITYKNDYALNAILDLAIHYDEGLVTIQAVAKHIDAPSKFLEQVLSELKKGGFIESRRGKVGGYILSKPPKKITLGEVLRFVDSSLQPIACVDKSYSDCKSLHKCVFRPIWQRVFKATSDIVDHITFEDLAKQNESAQKVPMYSI